MVWLLSAYPWEPVHSGGKYLIGASYIGSLGHVVELVLRPLGFDWRSAIALFFCFLAKKWLLATFGVLGLGGAEELQQVFTPVTGLAFMVFTLIYIPCLTTIGIIYRETNSWKWTIFTVVYGSVLAYLVASVIMGIETFRILGE